VPDDAGAFPTIEELNGLSGADFAAAMTRLFEGGARFLARLADSRPFEQDEALIGAAREIAHAMPDDEQIELLAAHPRIGADPDALSPASQREQGYGQADAYGGGVEEEDEDEDEMEPPGQPAYIGEELAMLNEIYEAHFGFRYVVFVAGRPREAIIPLMETALRNDRDAERRRGVDETIYIAADRLAAMRPPEPEAEAEVEG
jgi:2-oxo-4-hydroxy-4-carboxy--5-ureidoimidazoline (OHCU) decarboxylase